MIYLYDNIKIQKYKGLKYFIEKVKEFHCGYIILDKELFNSLGLNYCKNHTSDESGNITYIFNPDKLGLKGLKHNETFFGFDLNHIYSYNRDYDKAETIAKEWINWIVKKLENKRRN
ncbi:hypothetical protein [Campylobacter sp. US33a]|uniref:hypothetical protein n=1 Tax=Campylobacter sp. US33a TaxID=2498120 RepID=UPI0010685118|nr:hypothetical protein [Campylobacter sp. US33a]TEY00699.1 hypothetical protein ELQ16_08675 [Campylobacter sp. US33a]